MKKIVLILLLAAYAWTPLSAWAPRINMLHEKTGGWSEFTDVTKKDFNAAVQATWGEDLSQYHYGTQKYRIGEFNLTYFQNLAQLHQGLFAQATAQTYLSGVTRHEVTILDLLVGHAWAFRHHQTLSVSLRSTIPTTKDDFYSLGGEVEYKKRLFGNDRHNVNIKANMRYRYLFERKMNWPIGIKDRVSGKTLILREIPINVSPGSSFDLLTGLNYHYKKSIFEIGYHLFFKEGEEFGSIDFDMFNLTPPPGISKDDLVRTVSETCSTTKHSLYTSLAFVFKDFFVGGGAAYSWLDGRNANESSQVYLKSGFSF